MNFKNETNFGSLEKLSKLIIVPSLVLYYLIQAVQWNPTYYKTVLGHRRSDG